MSSPALAASAGIMDSPSRRAHSADSARSIAVAVDVDVVPSRRCLRGDGDDDGGGSNPRSAATSVAAGVSIAGGTHLLRPTTTIDGATTMGAGDDIDDDPSPTSRSTAASRDPVAAAGVRSFGVVIIA